MGRIDRGLDVVNGSVAVFRENPRLAVLPAATLLVVGVPLGGLGLYLLTEGLVWRVLTSDPLLYGLVFVAFGLSSTLGVLFNVALAHCVSRRFAGEEPSVREGLAVAWRRRRTVVAWGLANATLGTLFMYLDDQFGFLGTASRAVFGVAWGLLSFFVVPVLALDGEHSLRGTLRKSGETFRETWGESLSADFGLSVVFLLAAVPGLLIAAVGYVESGPAALAASAVGVGLVVACQVAYTTTDVIARVALYRYAETGDHVGPFADRRPETVLRES